jgi:protein phosphatase
MDLSKKIEVVNISDVGKKRPHNEDSTISDANNGIVILADGMGGYKAGEVASALAVTSILHDISTGMKKLKRGRIDQKTGFSHESILIRDAIINANGNIFGTAQTDPQCQGMGTTIVVGMFYNNILSIAYVGDSRLYRLRNNKLKQITRDHSLIQELIDRGMYTPEEAAEKTPKNLVTRALGIDAEVKVDIMEESVTPGDIYLLCSDGLNDMVNDEEIHLTLSKYSANLVQTGQELVELANSYGGKDNISVILARIRQSFEAPAGLVEQIKTRFF